MVMTACSRKEAPVERYMQRVTMEFRADSIHASTKSSVLGSPDDESRINSATVIASDEYGEVIKAYTESSSAVLNLKPGRDYTFDVFVNMGDIRTEIESHSEASAYRHAVSNESIARDGLPMYGRKELTMTASTSRIVVDVDRLVARYELRFSTAGITSGTMMVKDVQMKNVSRIVSSESFCAHSGSEIIENGDHASEDDIRLINYGQSACFYLPENLQGTEYGIRIPSDKIPTYSFTGVNPELCSYLEVTCSYAIAGGEMGDDVIYRMYLGANSTSDFNIRRNTQYSLTLQPMDVNPEQPWWKCEPRFEYERALVVSPAEAWLSVGESQQFQAHLVKSLHGSILEQREVTAECAWDITSGESSIIGEGNGLFTAEEEGTAYIQAYLDEWTSELVPVHVQSRQKNVTIDITANPGTSTVYYSVLATNDIEQVSCSSFGNVGRVTRTVTVSKGSGHDIFHVSTNTISNQSRLDYLLYDVVIDGEHHFGNGDFQIDWSDPADETHVIVVNPVFPWSRSFTLYATPPNGQNGLSVGLSYINNSYDIEADVEAGRGVYFLTTEANYGATTTASKDIQVFGDKFKVSGYRVFGSTANTVEVYANGMKVYSGQIGTENSTNRFETPVFEMSSDNMAITVYLR